MEQPILKGSIYITSDIDVVYNYPIGDQNKIITLDEEDLLQQDDQNIIGGSCLLPPIMAKIAESDGDEYAYEMQYKDHLLNTYQQEFIGALLSALYKGKNLLLFIPELGYTYTRDKLCEYMYQLFGVGIGLMEFDKQSNSVIIRRPYMYDMSAAPIWLNLVYEARVIGPYEYLIMYPADANLRTNIKIMNILVSDLHPYAETINDKFDIIIKLHKRLHKNPNVRLPIHTLINRG